MPLGEQCLLPSSHSLNLQTLMNFWTALWYWVPCNNTKDYMLTIWDNGNKMFFLTLHRLNNISSNQFEMSWDKIAKWENAPQFIQKVQIWHNIDIRWRLNYPICNKIFKWFLPEKGKNDNRKRFLVKVGHRDGTKSDSWGWILLQY